MAACLVVGAGDGVGGAIARAFAAEGMEVCIRRRAAMRSGWWMCLSAVRC